MYLIERPILGDMLPQLQHFEMYQYHRLEKVSVSFLTVFFIIIILRIFQKWKCQSHFFKLLLLLWIFSLFFHWHPNIAEH